MKADPGVAFLAGLAGDDVAQRVGRRLRYGERRGLSEWPWQSAHELARLQMPASALLWMLEQDDPRLNAVVFYHYLADAAIRRDIVSGVPFGPGRSGRLKVPGRLSLHAQEVVPVARSAEELVTRLRSVFTMRHGRSAARSLSRERGDWAVVAAADREQPLPGYARWALAVRIDCPVELRAQFGSHPKFAYRLRQAGIVSGPGEYVETWRPAQSVLTVLDLGQQSLFPGRVEEAAEALRPRVRGELAGDVEAWAVLAQLLPTFSGTLPELVTTAAAVASAAA